MRIGIFSDAHGDVQGIKRALAALKAAEKIFYLGDVHEFVPTVPECIDLLQDYNVIAVKGNCDRHAVIGDGNGFYRAWLANLPKERTEGDMVYVHEPKDPEYSFGREKFHVCFCGHTHRSFLITSEGRQQLLPGQVVLDKKQQYIIGIGSVSRPRAGESKAAALYETETGELELIRL